MNIEIVALDVLIFILRISVGALFVVAGVLKLCSGHNHVLRTILNFELLPYWISRTLSRILPITEVIVGVTLILGIFLWYSVLMSFIILFSTTLALVSSLVRGLKHDCGCFGIQGTQQVSWRIVYRNLVLSSALAIIYWSARSAPSLDDIMQLHVASEPYIVGPLLGGLVLVTFCLAIALSLGIRSRRRTRQPS